MNKTELLNILSNAGWYNERRIDSSYITEDLQNQWFTIPNSLISNTISEFGNLKIEHFNENNIYIDIVLNIETAITMTDYTENRNIEIVVNEKVVPIGTAFNDSYLIWITYSEKIYITDDDSIYYLSDNFLDSLLYLFNMPKPKNPIAKIHS